MARPKTEIGRRLSAALTLAGMTKEELGERMNGDGLGLSDPDEISQGRKQPQKAHFDSMSLHLGVPPEWFQVEDFQRWLSRLRAPSAAEVAQASDEARAHFEMAEALAELAEAQLALDRAQEKLTRSEPKLGGSGSD